MTLEPGAIVQLSSVDTFWIVDECAVDAFVTIAELRPAWGCLEGS
jgi:hypothetical protein